MENKRITRLQAIMAKQEIDLYYFNTSDYHMSEYVAEYFKTISYFSGFTGSLATLLVSRSEAFIFVDGRYHIQADKQCAPNNVKVIKLGTKGALEPLEFIDKYFKGATIGLDGKRASISFVKSLLDKKYNVKSIDIYSSLIENRVPLKNNCIYEIDDKYTGLGRRDKLKLMYYYINDGVHIINNLESIAYLLNLRSDDIAHTPVFMAYMVLMDKTSYLFINGKRFREDTLNNILRDNIKVIPYDLYYEFLRKIKGRNILLDENKVNYETYLNICNDNRIINGLSVVERMKAIKNPIEQSNLRLAHIYDGVAVVRFLKWLSEVDKTSITEYDAARKIDEFRTTYRAYDTSFDSIVAYNKNAALMHYFPTKKKSSRLNNKGILLFDTGGQYFEGTTDITRTVALGEVSDDVKKWFTLVLKSMFNLSELVFLSGMSGRTIDIIARKDLWKQHVDYRCGTGHGVGYNLAVHENPPRIFYGSSEASEFVFTKGMVVSDEPGVYFEGKYGIRCENMLLCQKDDTNEYGDFLKFETLTLVPFDLNLIDKKYLDIDTINALNAYHERVYKTLSPYLNDKERKFLRGLTTKI